MLAANHERPAEVVASEHPVPCVTRVCQHSFMSDTHTVSAPSPAPVLGAQRQVSVMSLDFIVGTVSSPIMT